MSNLVPLIQCSLDQNVEVNLRCQGDKNDLSLLVLRGVLERVLEVSSRYPERPKLVSPEGIIEAKYYRESDKRIEGYWWIRGTKGVRRTAGS